MSRLDDTLEDLTWTEFEDFLSSNSVKASYLEFSDKYYLRATNEAFTVGCIIAKDSGADQIDFETNYKDLINTLAAKALSIDPFAVPMYAINHDGISAPVTCNVNATTNVDYLIPAEKYIFGGEMLLNGVQFGDKVSASIVDVDAVIPEAYREATCEDWPTVSTYIVDHYVDCRSSIGYVHVDTRPLCSKITAGLYLRIAVTTTNAGSARSAVMTYFFAVKV
jgi:hypothetical protein